MYKKGFETVNSLEIWCDFQISIWNWLFEIRFSFSLKRYISNRFNFCFSILFIFYFFCRTKRHNCTHIVHRCCVWMHQFTVGWHVTRNVNKSKCQPVKVLCLQLQHQLIVEMRMKMSIRLKIQHLNRRQLQSKKYRPQRTRLAHQSMPMIAHLTKNFTNNWKTKWAICTRCGMKLTRGKFPNAIFIKSFSFWIV